MSIDDLTLKLKKASDFIDASQWDQANAALEDILDTHPNCGLAHYGLGSIAFQHQSFESAIIHHERALALNSPHTEAIRQIAWSHLLLKDWPQALTYCHRLLNLKPDDIQANYNLGVIYLNLRHDKQAKSAFEKTLSLQPDYADALVNLCAVNLRLGLKDEAQLGYQTILNLHPNHPIASYMLSALTENKQHVATPHEFIAHLYDGYAARYDESMLNELNYQIPHLFFNIIQQLDQSDSKYHILELGCGTGLTGLKIKLLAHRLIGVDLSSQMLKIAKQKAIYDELHCQPIQDFLNQTTHSFDLIVAADVLIYTGDLTSLFSTMKRALKKSGYFLFSTEYFLGESYHLNLTGRYSHSPEYIKRLLDTYHLKLILEQKASLRFQQGKAVEGMIYLATLR